MPNHNHQESNETSFNISHEDYSSSSNSLNNTHNMHHTNHQLHQNHHHHSSNANQHIASDEITIPPNSGIAGGEIIWAEEEAEITSDSNRYNDTKEKSPNTHINTGSSSKTTESQESGQAFSSNMIQKSSSKTSFPTIHENNTNGNINDTNENNKTNYQITLEENLYDNLGTCEKAENRNLYASDNDNNSNNNNNNNDNSNNNSNSNNNNNEKPQEEADILDSAGQIKFDRGYAWVVCLAGTFINAFSWGASGSFGIFLATYLSSNMYPGATREDFAFVGGLQFGVGLMISPLIIYIVQYVRYSVVICVGACLQAAAYIAASYATEKWHLFLTQGVLSGIGLGTVFIPANAAIPQWFVKRRGVANGIFTSGAGLGSIIFSLSVQALIDKIGLRWAQRYVGFFTLGACILCGLLVRERKEIPKKKLAAFKFSLLKLGYIWLVIIWGAITMFCYGIVLYTMAPFAVNIGLTHQQGSVLSAIFSTGLIIGRPVLGHLADTIGSINAGMVSTLLSSLFILAWWIPANSYGSLIALNLILGSVISAFSVGFPPICASLVKLQDLSALLSMSWPIIGAINIFSTPTAIGLTKIDGTYLYSQILTGLLFFVSFLILLVTRGIRIRLAENIKLRDEKEESSETNMEISSGDKPYKQEPFYKLMFKFTKL